MTRDEYLAWAKGRALEYVDRGELLGNQTQLHLAIASMVSDLAKHEAFDPAFIDIAGQTGTMEALTRGAPGVRSWVEGFN